MKHGFTKIFSAALAATLLTTTAVSAASRDRFVRPAPRAQYHNNSNAAALGFGLFALGALAIIASQSNRNTARYDDRYYAPSPPPQYGNGYYGPSTDYYYGRDNYGRNYGQSYAPSPYDYRR
jgi:hypothetical protein